MTERLQCDTTRFGRVEADAAEVIEFPGLPGFPGAQRFVLRQHDRGAVLAWLVSLDDPDLAFVVVNPWHLVPDYAPAVAARELRLLDVESADELEVVVIATVADGTATLNLAAPLLIHPGSRRGVQVILDDDRYSTRVTAPIATSAQMESNPDT
ncbi:MAG: flagellar assembly protein FliW [Myxococcota bacterium]|nr:flagellar assembly protein FliW [Myxococcota bacterium]